MAVAVFGQSTEAMAHASMVKSDPPSRSVVGFSPPELRLWFTEQLEPAYASAMVLSDYGAPLTTDKAEVSKGDPRLLVLKLPLLKPGKYTVKYKVLSVDGHVVDGSYAFTIKAPPAGR